MIKTRKRDMEFSSLGVTVLLSQAERGRGGEGDGGRGRELVEGEERKVWERLRASP